MMQLVILVGPKGSGKSTIGTILSQVLPVCFFRVEPIFVANQVEGGLAGDALLWRGFERVEARLDELFEQHETVVIETTAAWGPYAEILRRYRERYTVRLVRLRAPLATCLDRVRTRDASEHIPVSDDRVHAINEIADRIELDWDLELDNSTPASAEAIRVAFAPLVAPRT